MISWLRLRLSLRFLLSFGVGAAILCGGLATFFGIDFESTQVRRAQAHAILARAADSFVQSIETDIRAIGRDVNLAAQNNVLRSEAEPVPLLQFLAKWAKERPDYSDILLADRSGHIKATASTKFVGFDVSGSSWFEQALNRTAIGSSSQNARAGTELPPNVIVAAPVSDAAGSVGVLAVQLKRDWMSRLTEPLRASLGDNRENIFFEIIDASGRVIYAAGRKGVENDRNLVEASSSLSEGQGLGWLVVARAIPDALVPPAHHLLGFALLLAAAVLGAFVAGMGAKFLSRDIRTKFDAAVLGQRQANLGPVVVKDAQPLIDKVAALLDQGHSKDRLLKDTKHALSRSRERLRAFEAMAGWTCWEIDVAKGLVMWSDPASKILSSSSENAASLDELFERLLPDDRNLLRTALSAALASKGETQDISLRTVPFESEPYGRRLLLRMTKCEADNEVGARVFVLSREVDSEGAHLGQPAAVAPQQALLAGDPVTERRKDNLTRQITEGIVHDIDNALTVVMVALDAAKQGDTASGRALASIETALRAARRGAALTRRVTAIVRRKAPPQPQTNVNLLMEELSDMLRTSVAQQCVMAFSVEPNLPAILCSEQQFEVALLNLVLDSKASMTGEDVISITVEKTPCDAKTAATPLGVKLSFSAPGDLSKGRGLQSVRALMEQIGGSSELVIGNYSSTVHLRFPTTTVAQGTSFAAKPDTKPLNILFVESDALLRVTAASALTAAGHKVTQAASGQEAMQILSERRDLDAMIADSAEAQMAEVVSRTHPMMRIVMTAPRGHFPTRAARFGRLDKPFGVAELMHALSEAPTGEWAAKTTSAA